MGNRKRDDVSAVCEHIVAHASGWRDRCGAEYCVEEETKVFDDRIVMKLGFFDELRCSDVGHMDSLALPESFVVRAVHCNMRKQYVCVSVYRSSAPGLAASLRALTKTDTSSAPNDFLEIAYEVSPEDADAVHAAISKVLSSFERTGDATLLSISRRATCYDVCFKVASALVPGTACRAAAAYDGVLNFETSHLDIQVPKKFTNIS